MGKKKTFLVDNSPVDVEEQDVKDFLKYNKSAIEARSYIVGKDTVDVALTDVADFEANVKDAKPLYGEEPKQSDPYAPKPVTFGTTTSVSPIIPEKPQTVTNDQKNRAKNYGDVVGQIKNMQGELTTINNRLDSENSTIFLDADTDKQKAELEKNIAVYNKAISTNVAQHTKDLYAKWDKEITDITPYTTTASTGGVTVHDTEKTFAEADKLAKEYGQEGTDFNTFVKLAFSQYVENRISQPTIEKYANEAFKKINNTDKSIPETAQEDFEQGFKEKGAIIGKANAELAVVANAVKAEYAPEKEQLKQDSSHISADFWKDTQQYEMDYTASQWQLNNEYQQGKVSKEEYKAASDQAYNAYKAEFEQRQKESIETSALLAKTERDINLKIQRTYNQRRDMLMRGYDNSLQEAAKKYSAKYKASPEFEANVNKAYSMAYDRYNKDRERALKQDMDVKGVVGMGTNTAWAMKNFGLVVSESVGNSIRSYGVMWNNAAMMKIGDEMATNIELPESKIRTDQIMSDLLSYRGLLTAGQITGSGLPGIVVGAASAAVGNVAGVSAGLTAAVGGVIALGQETNDMAASMYAETMAETGNAATASEKAKQIVKGQTVMLIPSVLHMTSFMKGINFGIKNKTLSYATKVTGEMATNIFEENYQNPMEEAVRKKGDWTMLGEYITKEGIVETTANVLPMFGQTLVTTRAEGEAKGVDIKAQAAKFISDKNLAEILANRGDSFAQKELYDTQRVMGDNFALTTVQQMYTQGLIDDKQLNTLTAAVATNNQITQQIEALKLNPEQGLMYRALVHKQTEAANDMASATSDVEKNYFATQEQNVSAQLKLLAEGKDADVVMLTMPNGSQHILTTAEANQMFTDPDFIEQVKQGKSVDIKSYGKAVEGIKDSLKKLEGIIQSEKAAATTSDTQTETTSDTQTTQPETQPQTAEERAAAVLARVKRAPQTEKQKLEEELKAATDQEVRTNIGEQITLHETKAQHEQKLKEIEGNIANLSENGKVLENLAKINALAAEKTKTEEIISDIDKQLKTKQNERETKAQKGRKKDVLNKGWHDLEEADRITVGGVGAKVDGVNKNLNGSVFSINYTLDDGTKGEARISGQDIVDENGKAVLLKMDNVIQSEKAAPQAETKPTEVKDKGVGSGVGDVALNKERERLKTKLEKLEYQDPSTNVIVRLNSDGTFKDAGSYDSKGVWSSSSNNGEQAVKNAQTQSYPRVKKLYDIDVKLNEVVNSKLADDLVLLKEKLGGLKQLEQAFEGLPYEQVGSISYISKSIDEFLKRGLQSNKVEGISKAVESLLSKEQTQSESNTALRDVSSRTFIQETNADTFDEFDINKAGSGQGNNWLGRGIYLQEKGTFKIETYGKNKVEATLNPNAKIFEAKETPNGNYRDSFVEWAVKNTEVGKRKAQERIDDGLSLDNLLPRDILKNNTEAVEKLKEQGYDGLYMDGELVVYNPKVLEIKKSESLLSKEQTQSESNPALSDVESIENRNKQTEAKIKNKGLFLAEYDENGNKIGDSVGEIISQSDIAPIATSVREQNGFEFVEFSNPQTGEVDVIVTGDTKGNYVGFYRLYENGKPTNKWSSKMNSKDKNAFKTMMSGVQEMLPQGHEYSEKTSISTDGLRVWNQQLQRGYELQYDNNGKLITDTVAINGDALINELDINVNQGNFDNIRVSNKEDFNKVKKALLPYLEKFGLNQSNINWVNGTVEIDLPVLKKSESLLSKEQTKTTSDNKTKNDNTTDKGNTTKGDRGVQDEASGVVDGVPTKKEEAAAKGEAEQKNKQTDSTSKLEYIQEDQIPESVMVDVLDAKGNNVKVMDDILGRDGKKIGQELVNKQATLTKKDVIKKQREISNKENRLINLIDCLTKKKK